MEVFLYFRIIEEKKIVLDAMEENIDADMEEMGEKKEYKCAQCEAKYSCRQNLYRHQLQCLKQKKLICDLFEKVFDRIDVMKRHKINCKGKVNNI